MAPEPLPIPPHHRRIRTVFYHLAFLVVRCPVSNGIRKREPRQISQEVCPWNGEKFVRITGERDYLPRRPSPSPSPSPKRPESESGKEQQTRPVRQLARRVAQSQRSRTALHMRPRSDSVDTHRLGVSRCGKTAPTSPRNVRPQAVFRIPSLFISAQAPQGPGLVFCWVLPCDEDEPPVVFYGADPVVQVRSRKGTLPVREGRKGRS